MFKMIFSPWVAKILHWHLSPFLKSTGSIPEGGLYTPVNCGEPNLAAVSWRRLLHFLHRSTWSVSPTYFPSEAENLSRSTWFCHLICPATSRALIESACLQDITLAEADSLTNFWHRRLEHFSLTLTIKAMLSLELWNSILEKGVRKLFGWYWWKKCFCWGEPPPLRSGIAPGFVGYLPVVESCPSKFPESLCTSFEVSFEASCQ